MATINAWNSALPAQVSFGGTGNATLTSHSVLVGAGTGNVVQVGPGSTAGVPLISAGASADPAYGTALVVGGGTGSTSFNTAGVVISAASSTGALTALSLVDGQVVIGSSIGQPLAATLTAGANISISNGHNTITIAGTGAAGFSWEVDTGASVSMVSNKGYIANNAGTIAYALPASSAVGDMLRVTGINNATGWQITQALGQQIFFGVVSTTSGTGGSLASSATRDAVEMVCVAANTTWQVLSSIGNITYV